MRQYNFDPIKEIQKIVGDVPLSEILAASETRLSLGEKAHLATALQAIGLALESSVKEEALDRVRNEKSFVDFGVEFRHHPESERTYVNTTEVRNRFPPNEEKSKDFYYKRVILETIAIKIGTPPQK